MTLRHDWQKQEIAALYDQPLMDLLLQAQTIHRENFPANQVQLAQLLSIKTGACPEDCNYCSQSGHHDAEIQKEKLLDVDSVVEEAKRAKAAGSTRFCMGAAWRSPPKKALPALKEMVQRVKALGMETCVTAGMLDEECVDALEEAGLDYYNHNIDTSPEYYDKVITTRTFQDRIDTLNLVRKSSIKVCCGGIMGLGETRDDRISFLQALANLDAHPESVPINKLIAVPGTPFAEREPLDDIEFVRTIAVARIIMPKSAVRLSAGRDKMNDATQALCFMAGANSLFNGEVLLTCKNPEPSKDEKLLSKLGMTAQAA